MRGKALIIFPVSVIPLSPVNNCMGCSRNREISKRGCWRGAGRGQSAPPLYLQPAVCLHTWARVILAPPERLAIRSSVTLPAILRSVCRWGNWGSKQVRNWPEGDTGRERPSFFLSLCCPEVIPAPHSRPSAAPVFIRIEPHSLVWLLILRYYAQTWDHERKEADTGVAPTHHKKETPKKRPKCWKSIAVGDGALSGPDGSPIHQLEHSGPVTPTKYSAQLILAPSSNGSARTRCVSVLFLLYFRI